MLIINVCGEITLFDGSILFLCIKKIMLYCSGAVACGQVPCKRAESFVPCECDKSACVLRSTKCHLSLQLHPFLLFVFLLCSFNWKEKKTWMHEKRKWCHQSNHFASKGKDSTYNQLAKGHENILEGNWAPFVEILWYIPLTCSVLLRNNAYGQRYITGPLCSAKSCSYHHVQRHLKAGTVHVLLLEGYVHNRFKLFMTWFFVLSPMMFFTSELEKCMAFSDPSQSSYLESFFL